MRNSSRTIDYFEFCERRLWRPWLDDPATISKAIEKPFETEFAPEPYLRFSTTGSANRRPLRFLLTNPGNSMPHQRRASLRAGRHGIDARMTYAEASLALGNFYCVKLKGAARRRIEAMLRLAKEIGADSVTQFETIPFHSKSLPGKRKLPGLIDSTAVLRDYAQALTSTLAKHTVIALSAAPTKAALSAETIKKSPWLNRQAEFMGITAIDRMETVPLVTNRSGPTCVFVRSAEHHGSGFVLMMGGNNFPGSEGLAKLAEAIRDTD